MSVPSLLNYKPLVERYLKETPAKLSAFSFVTIFVWQDFFQFQFEEIDGNLCIFADADGTFLYLPPLGHAISREATDLIFERLRTLNKGKSVTRIENVTEEQLRHFPSGDYKIYKKGYEYFYYRRDLVGLKGDEYKSKRHACNHFVKTYSVCYRPYEKSMAVECDALFNLWSQEKRRKTTDEIDLALLEDNKAVHRRILESFKDLDIIGRVVEMKGKIVAYTFGYFVKTDVFCDLVEIADTRYKGLATYIFNQFCNDPALGDVKFINVMDDFAMEKVNHTKMSFRPTILMPAYTVSLWS